MGGAARCVYVCVCACVCACVYTVAWPFLVTLLRQLQQCEAACCVAAVMTTMLHKRLGGAERVTQVRAVIPNDNKESLLAGAACLYCRPQTRNSHSTSSQEHITMFSFMDIQATCQLK